MYKLWGGTYSSGVDNLFPLFKGDLGTPRPEEAALAWVPIMALQTLRRTLDPAQLKKPNDLVPPVVLKTLRGDMIIQDGDHYLANQILTMRSYAQVLLTPVRF